MNALTDIHNFLPLWENVATSGQPTEEQLPAVTESGFEVVINLLPKSQLLSGEREFFQNAGLEFVHIPVIWTEPTLDEFEQFVAAMQARTAKRVYIHCAANMRASVFCYLYRTLHLGIPTEEAQTDLNRIWTPNPIWQRFLVSVEKRYRSRTQER
jgi:protein tyrosine phosphatase (PTP) superfamily phosphohydrolase (DUF442 family)